MLTPLALLALNKTQPASGEKGDWLDGGDGNDVLAGSGGSDALYGGAGDDFADGNAANLPVWRIAA